MMMEEVMHVVGAGKSLYLPVNFVLILKLLYKNKIFKKHKAIGGSPLLIGNGRIQTQKKGVLGWVEPPMQLNCIE